MSTVVTLDRRLGDLTRLLDGLAGLHGELFRLLDAKIEASRRADLAAMQGAGQNEQNLLVAIRNRNGLRAQLMAVLGRELGIPAGSGAVSVSKIAARLSEAQRPLLNEAAARLQAIMAKVSQANRLAAAIARDILQHMKWVFAAVQPRAAGGGYTAGGGSSGPSESVLFEAVV